VATDFNNTSLKFLYGDDFISTVKAKNAIQDGVIYFDNKLAPFVPSGWQLPSKEDFLEIEKALTSNGVTNVGTAMVSKGLCDSNEDGCGLVGFALRAEVDHFLVTNSKSYVRMRKSGTAFEYEGDPNADGVIGQIRFYQE
jgi:uncharacterized protein (TIGR02145 family)